MAERSAATGQFARDELHRPRCAVFVEEQIAQQGGAHRLPLVGGSRPRDVPLEWRKEPQQGLRDHGDVEFFLAAKVVADRREVGTGAVGDVANGSPFEAARGEDIEGRVQQALPRDLTAG